MAEVVRDAQQDFWRPPKAEPVALEPAPHSGMVEVCDQCETEFIAGSRFCHRCGSPRADALTAPGWTTEVKNLLRHLEFHNIEKGINRVRQYLGLSTAALVSFVVGVVCVLCALGIGLVFTVQTTLDWQALQLWRLQWLLGALVAFVAGVLLKRAAS